MQPGDLILVHAGLYKDTRFRYGGGIGTLFDGTYYLTASGTAERPIVIRAAGDGEVIFDGDGNSVLFDVTAASPLHFEGITFRNTEVAILAGRKRIIGSSGTWQQFPDFPVEMRSNVAVKVYGSGHVVAHNDISHFHDGVDHATYRTPDLNPDGSPVRERMPVSIDIIGIYGPRKEE